MTEIWRIIPTHPAYAASSHGRIRRELPGSGPTWPGKILKQRFDHEGYAVTSLSGRQIKVQRLVCAAFHGAPPEGRICSAHNDGDKTNNRPENLRWATDKENHADRDLHGTTARGERAGQARLNEAAVREIRAAIPVNGMRRALAEKFGVSIGLVAEIRAEKSKIWAHVS